MKLAILLVIGSLLLGRASAAPDSVSLVELAKLKAQRDQAVAQAITTVDRNYRTSLQQLLQRALVRQDADAVVTIQQAISSLAPASVDANPPPASSLAGNTGSPVGLWHWFTGSIVVIRPDGSAQGDDVRGHWTWDNQAKRSFHIAWERYGTNLMIMAANGMELQGTDKQKKFTAKRLSRSEANAWEKSLSGKDAPGTAKDLFGVPRTPAN